MATAVMIAAAALGWHGAGMAGAADMELGRYLAADCMACHHPTTGASTIPNIFGMAETRLIGVIKAYREKTLPNSVMQNAASRFTDEDIASLALYFAKTRKPK
jgi:cytochrome c